MKKTVLALAALGIAAGAAQAADSQILNSLLACNASYFKAIAKDKNIPETLKIRSGDMQCGDAESLAGFREGKI